MRLPDVRWPTCPFVDPEVSLANPLKPADCALPLDEERVCSSVGVSALLCVSEVLTLCWCSCRTGAALAVRVVRHGLRRLLD